MGAAPGKQIDLRQGNFDETRIAPASPKNIRASEASGSVKKVEMVEKENLRKESDRRSKRCRKDRASVEEPFKYLSRKERLLLSLEGSQSSAPPTPPVDFPRPKSRSRRRATNGAQTTLAGILNEIQIHRSPKKVDEVIQADMPPLRGVDVNTQTSSLSVLKRSSTDSVSSAPDSLQRLEAGDCDKESNRLTVHAFHAQTSETTRHKPKSKKCLNCHRSIDDFSTQAQYSGSSSKTEFSLLSPVDSTVLSGMSGRSSRSSRLKKLEKFREMEELGLGFVRGGKWVPTDVISRTIWTKIEKCTEDCQALWSRNSKSYGPREMD